MDPACHYRPEFAGANFQVSKILGFGNFSRQGARLQGCGQAKAPSVEGKDKYSYEFFSPFFPTLVAPSTSLRTCLASLREIFRVSVAVCRAGCFVVLSIFALVAALPR